MATSTTIPIQIRVDKKTKEEASELFEELGTSVSGAVNMFLRQCVNTGSIPFRVRGPHSTKELLEAMEEAEAMAMVVAKSLRHNNISLRHDIKLLLCTEMRLHN